MGMGRGAHDFSYSSVEVLLMGVTLMKTNTLKHSSLIAATDRQGSVPAAAPCVTYLCGTARANS